MERNLYAPPVEAILGDLLDRYEKEVSPLHKSHQVEKYR